MRSGRKPRPQIFSWRSVFVRLTRLNPKKKAWPKAGIEGAYGHNGVCHQVANRILWSAGVQPDGDALTVEGVKRWQLSWDIFGVYGYRDDSSNWEKVLGRCDGLGGSDLDLIKRMNTRVPMLSSRKAADNMRSTRKEILESKEKIDREHDQGEMTARQHADAVNALMREYLKEASHALGNADFLRYFQFDYTPEVTPVLVDPDVAEKYERLEARGKGEATATASA
jgi:hypothetical protein